MGLNSKPISRVKPTPPAAPPESANQATGASVPPAREVRHITKEKPDEMNVTDLLMTAAVLGLV